MAEPATAESYVEHRRRLLVASVPAAAAAFFFVVLLYLAILLLLHDTWPMDLIAPILVELALPSAIVLLASGRTRHPEAVLLAADQALLAALLAQLLLPHFTTSGVVLGLCLKMLATALFLPWGTRVQLFSSATSVLLYWMVLGLSGRSVGTADFAHQVAGPLLAAIVSIGGAARSERMRRTVFERDAKLAESDARLRALVDSMREGEARKGAIFESVPDALFTIDAGGTILELNGAAERIFGHSRRDAVGRLLDELIIPPSMREAHRRALAHHAATGQSAILGKRVEMAALRADGSEFPVEITINRVAHDGALMFTGCLRDLTERKLAEERARHQQAELAHALRVATLGEMAAELAHELNQPLAAIVNFAKGLATRLRAAAKSEEMVDAAELIAAEALRAAEVVRRQRDFVRRSEGTRQRCDLNALVRDAAHLIEPDARRSGIAVRLVLEPALPPVDVDRIQIEQVVLNLMRNGLEAIADAENGAADEDELLVETALSDGRVEVTVRDTGVGLPPAAEQKVFLAFYTTKEKGLGLGLSIGKSIVEEHRGRLWAVRNPYRGSTFGFTLPVSEPAEESKKRHIVSG